MRKSQVPGRNRATPIPKIKPAAAVGTRRRVIRSDIDGLGAVMTALGERQYDLHDVSAAEWQAMSPRQQAELLKSQNAQQSLDHRLGPAYVMSSALKNAVKRAHALYIEMTPAQRRRVLHPRHLDTWLRDRRIITIVTRDFEGPMPDYIQPKSYRIPDEGPSPAWPTRVYLTVTLNMDASVERTADAGRDLVTGLHAPAARRPRHSTSVRPTREKYDDDQLAQMIEWYYRQAKGDTPKQLAIETAGPTARHVATAQRKMFRQLRWFREELGIA